MYDRLTNEQKDTYEHLCAALKDVFQRLQLKVFRLCNASATFQWLMEYVLAVLQWEHCLIYLVFTNFQEHKLTRLEEVFERLKKAGL